MTPLRSLVSQLTMKLLLQSPELVVSLFILPLVAFIAPGRLSASPGGRLNGSAARRSLSTIERCWR